MARTTGSSPIHGMMGGRPWNFQDQAWCQRVWHRGPGVRGHRCGQRGCVNRVTREPELVLATERVADVMCPRSCQRCARHAEAISGLSGVQCGSLRRRWRAPDSTRNVDSSRTKDVPQKKKKKKKKKKKS